MPSNHGRPAGLVVPAVRALPDEEVRARRPVPVVAGPRGRGELRGLVPLRLVRHGVVVVPVSSRLEIWKRYASPKCIERPQSTKVVITFFSKVPHFLTHSQNSEPLLVGPEYYPAQTRTSRCAV